MIQVNQTGGGDSVRNSDNEATECAIDYIVTGATTKDEALDAVYEAAPNTYNGLSFSGVSFTSYQNDAMEISATYESSDSSSTSTDSNEDQFSWDISTSSQHINKALKVIDCYAVDGNSDNYKTLAIGWNGKKGASSVIAGTNILTGSMRETYKIYKKYSDLTNAYKRQINKCRGKVNSTAFKSWEAGEVLFLGVSSNGDTNRSAEIPLTFSFAIRENQKNVEVSAGIYASLAGWDTLTTIMDSSPNDKQIYPEVKAYVIHRVYEFVDFSVLGL